MCRNGFIFGLLTLHSLCINYLLAASIIRHDTSYWRELSQKNYYRQNVPSLISRGRGLYKNNLKMRDFQNEILVSVISIDNGEKNRYKNILSNWFCYISHHGLNPLLYLVPSKSASYENQVKELQSISIDANFMIYPTALFWSIVANKTLPIAQGHGKVDYEGDIPSFSHFGALVMLVPIYEVLLHGCNVIYLDVDIALIHDPIPFMMKGSADITVSLELRTCLYPSDRKTALATKWNELEPNTGVLRVLSNPKSISIFSQWLQRIVDENVSNDQKVLDFERFGARIIFDCNEHLNDMLNENSSYSTILLKTMNSNSTTSSSNTAKYCYLNEFMFQNGKIAFHCSSNHLGSAVEYLLSMKDQNLTTNNDIEPMMFPVIVHANYCGDKLLEFQNRGLRLNRAQIASIRSQYHDNITYSRHSVNNSDICHSFDQIKINYHNKDWNSAVRSADKEISDMKTSIFQEGVVTRLLNPNHMAVYYAYYNNELHEIIDVKAYKTKKYQSKFKYPEIRYDRNYNFIELMKKGIPFYGYTKVRVS